MILEGSTHSLKVEDSSYLKRIMDSIKKIAQSTRHETWVRLLNTKAKQSSMTLTLSDRAQLQSAKNRTDNHLHLSTLRCVHCSRKTRLHLLQVTRPHLLHPINPLQLHLTSPQLPPRFNLHQPIRVSWESQTTRQVKHVRSKPLFSLVNS